MSTKGMSRRNFLALFAGRRRWGRRPCRLRPNEVGRQGIERRRQSRRD